MLELPFESSWDRASLYSLAEWTNGLAFRDIQFSPAGKPVIKIAELKAGIAGQTKFTEQVFEPCYHVTKGDMLFSWSGNPDTSIDVFWWRGPDGWLNQHIFKVEPGKDCDELFFFYLLKFLNRLFAEIARNKQTTGLGHVTIKDLKEITVGLPSKDEQRTIAHILGAMDNKIELNRRMNETLEAMARAIFKSWFVDFDPVRAKAEGRQPFGMNSETAALFPDSFADSALGKIPNGWRAVPLPEAVHINPPRSLTHGQEATYLDMQNMPTRGHRPAGWINRPFVSGSRFAQGDTLLARITPCLENGKTAFVDFLRDGEVGWGSTEFIVLRPKPPLPVEFGYCLARSEDFREHAIQNMTGSSGRQRVPSDCFSQYFVVLPQEPIASCFGEKVSPLFAKARANGEESATLASIRDALLPKLISGEIRVKDAEPIVGSAV